KRQIPADCQSRIADSAGRVGWHTARKTSCLPDSQSHSVHNAWVCPPARPCERLGCARAGGSARATDMGVGMLCQYSRQPPVSSEKHATAAEAGVEEEGCPRRRGDRHGGGYRALPESLTAITLMANPMKVLRSRTPARLNVYEAVLEGLAQALQDMASARRQF